MAALRRTINLASASLQSPGCALHGIPFRRSRLRFKWQVAFLGSALAAIATADPPWWRSPGDVGDRLAARSTLAL